MLRAKELPSTSKHVVGYIKGLTFMINWPSQIMQSIKINLSDSCQNKKFSHAFDWISSRKAI